MDKSVFDELERTLSDNGPQAAVEQLCTSLRQSKDYAGLFYALLLKRRYELGVSPVPTEAAQSLPERAHGPYEEAIREAGRLVGGLYLADGDIPRAWNYFRMLGEPEPVAQALEQYQPKEGEDCQQIIEIAYHHGVNPRRGFDWILNRHGICSAITMVSSQEFSQPEIREYCIKGLVKALYEQLRERLNEDIARREGSVPQEKTVTELMSGRDWLFDDECYHIDVSHLSAVVQMSIHLPGGEELSKARELCAYGRRLSPRFQYPGDPPFEDQYGDYGIYLSILAGEDQDAGIAHFRGKLASVAADSAGPVPAEVLVNLLVRVQRPADALEVARKHLAGVANSRPFCPGVAELCRLTNDYRALAEVAREQDDPVHFMAGLLLMRNSKAASSRSR